jgi:hypothetical protein
MVPSQRQGQALRPANDESQCPESARRTFENDRGLFHGFWPSQTRAKVVHTDTIDSHPQVVPSSGVRNAGHQPAWLHGVYPALLGSHSKSGTIPYARLMLRLLLRAQFRQCPPRGGQLLALCLRLGQFLAHRDSLLETLRPGERPAALLFVEGHLGIPLLSWTARCRGTLHREPL